MLLKEREAVQTILEHKIQVLAKSVSRSVSLVINNIPENGGAVGSALTKDIAALERLIMASIIAMKNSSNTATTNTTSNVPVSSIKSSSYSSSNS